jgi:hypothetical protein
MQVVLVHQGKVLQVALVAVMLLQVLQVVVVEKALWVLAVE